MRAGRRSLCWPRALAWRNCSPRRGSSAARVGLAHQQHVARVQRAVQHLLHVDSLAQFAHQAEVDAVGNLQAVMAVHGDELMVFLLFEIDCGADLGKSPPPKLVVRSVRMRAGRLFVPHATVDQNALPWTDEPATHFRHAADACRTALPPSRAEGFQRVARWLPSVGHDPAPLWLEVGGAHLAGGGRCPGRGAGADRQERGLPPPVPTTRRCWSSPRATGAWTSSKLAALVGPVGRADASFVKSRTGFAIGGVSPVGAGGRALHAASIAICSASIASGPRPAIPNGVFRLSPADLQRLTGAPWADVVQA